MKKLFRVRKVQASPAPGKKAFNSRAMSPSPHEVPIVQSTAIFKPDIFKGKVLFCTGGGSGICRGMTEAMVRIFCVLFLL